jgi:hypothetical protein
MALHRFSWDFFADEHPLGCEFMYLLRLSKASLISKMSLGFIYPACIAQGTSWQNSVLLDDLCCTAHETWLPYMDVNAAV